MTGKENMMSKKGIEITPFKKSFFFLLLVVFCSAFILFFYQKIIFSPNEYLFSSGADGLKNYFTFAYHIKHDSSYAHFEGMNYPYGEVLVYTDAQPSIANQIKLIASVFPNITEYSIGITNWLMVVSLLISAIFLYLIMLRLKMPPLFSVFGAIGIAILTPQVHRFVGHFALSYSFIFPIIWYLLARFVDSTNRKWLWTTLIVLCNFMWVFLHPYLGLICGFFLFFYWIVYFLQNRNRIRTNILHAVFQSGLALVGFKIILMLLDKHQARPTTPNGLFKYNANLETIFLPYFGPIRKFINSFYKVENQVWEGWAYVGIVALLIILFSVYKAIRYMLKGRFKFIYRPVLPPLLRSSLWASVLLLLLAMGYPYKWNLETLLEWLPFLKQFRGSGRMAWVFYYVITVYSLYVIYLMYKLLKRKSKPILAFGLVLISLSLFFIEAVPVHSAISWEITKNKNIFNNNILKSDPELLKSVDFDEYQAIIPLPFYHIGSEVFDKEASEKSHELSQLFSYFSGTPILASSLSRTSETETKNTLQIFSPFSKNITNHFPNQKPFLILHSKEELTMLEDQLLSKATVIYKDDKFNLYELTYEDMVENYSDKEISKFNTIKNQLKPSGEFLTTDSTGYLHYNSFNQDNNEVSFRGKGSYTNLNDEYLILWKNLPNDLIVDSTYTASFWVYIQGGTLNPIYAVVEEKLENNTAKWVNITPIKNLVIIQDEWILVSVDFTYKYPNSKVTLFLHSNNLKEKPLLVDEILIRPKNTDVYKIVSENSSGVVELYKNNLIFHTSGKN